MRPEPAAGVAVAVLAAGAGTRLGGPKALARWDGRIFLDHVLDAIGRARLGAPVGVVTGAEAETVALRAGGRGALPIHNPDWATGGMRSSILAAIGALSPVRALVVWPVDHPAVRPATVAALVEAWRRTGAPAVVPELGGRGGHPVLFDASLFPALRRTPASQGARALVRALGPRVLRLPVDDPGVRLDVDTPEILAHLQTFGPGGTAA